MPRAKRTLSSSPAFCAVFLCAIFFLALPTGTQKHELIESRQNVKRGENDAVLDHQTPLKLDSTLRIVENEGQLVGPVRFVSHGDGYQLFLMPQDAVLALNPVHRLDLSPAHRAAFFRNRRAMRANTKTSYVKVHLVNSNPGSKIAGMEPAVGRVDYFLGSDRTK